MERATPKELLLNLSLSLAAPSSGRNGVRVCAALFRSIQATSTVTRTPHSGVCRRVLHSYKRTRVPLMKETYLFIYTHTTTATTTHTATGIYYDGAVDYIFHSDSAFLFVALSVWSSSESESPTLDSSKCL